MGIHTVQKRLIEMDLTADKIDELLKDESDAAKEYSAFAEKLRRLSRESTQPETIESLERKAADFASMARDELRHHKLLGRMQDDVPSRDDAPASCIKT